MTTASRTSRPKRASASAARPRPSSPASSAFRPRSLPPADRVTRGILRRSLAEAIEADDFGQRDMLFTTYDGWHQNFVGMARNLPFRTRADYESYLTRIAQYPRLNDQALAITRNAVRGGYVLPCSVLGGHERSIAGVIAQDPTRSRFYEPFAGARPAAIPEADWAQLQARARRTIADVLNPAYQRHLDFYRTEYLPHCARSDSISRPAERRRILRLPGAAADHHRPDAAADPRHRPARGRPHPRGDGSGRPRGRLSEPRGLYPGPAHQPALLSPPSPSS